MTVERKRLTDSSAGKAPWKKWGPYLTERQWGTVREDYSPFGTAWEYVSHDMARSKTHRWGEDGIADICDDKQLLCFSLALWNGNDPILKERIFGLTGNEGNHGEDVKEYYYYLDSTPTHSYMKMLYKYPQKEFPYNWLIEENRRRGKDEPEFELIDTGIFDNDRYFDVFVEYAKADPEDILIRITVFNRGSEDAALNLLPQIWFRNTWAWGSDGHKPKMAKANDNSILIEQADLGTMRLSCEGRPELLFCENETNARRLYGMQDAKGYFKDGINDYIVDGQKDAVNSKQTGTKAAANYKLKISPGKSVELRMRLSKSDQAKPFQHFDEIFSTRLKEADEFYAELQREIKRQGRTQCSAPGPRRHALV